MNPFGFAILYICEEGGINREVSSEKLTLFHAGGKSAGYERRRRRLTDPDVFYRARSD